MMKPTLLCTMLLGAGVCGLGVMNAPVQGASYPVPSVYPVSWQFKFSHATPKRIVVDIPGQGPEAYYYLTYTVTNDSGQERTFFPVFDLVTKTGHMIRNDDKVPAVVFAAVKKREGNKFLESANEIAGELRLGKDQARDGVAIWHEPDAEMGEFSIYVGGLSGEYVILKDDKGNEVKDAKGNPIILRKTLQLNYIIRGDDVYPGEDVVNENPEKWVMR